MGSVYVFCLLLVDLGQKKYQRVSNFVVGLMYPAVASAGWRASAHESRRILDIVREFFIEFVTLEGVITPLVVCFPTFAHWKIVHVVNWKAKFLFNCKLCARSR